MASSSYPTICFIENLKKDVQKKTSSFFFKKYPDLSALISALCLLSCIRKSLPVVSMPKWLIVFGHKILPDLYVEAPLKSKTKG